MQAEQINTRHTLNVGDLGGKVLAVSDGGRELAGLGETRTQETRNLLDESLGSHESIVLLGQLLNELLVLVELLEIVDRHVLWGRRGSAKVEPP